jgi:hypothetical protein
MTFLPVAERELRVAARKRGTFWVRISAALVALVIAGLFLVFALFPPFAMSPQSLGGGLFATLTWIGLVVSLSAGLFFTSDCMSEEKREGTLGFLFLTDLKGYDVVIGKLLATSLRGFYALLAVLPILALTLTMGGITGTQFWRTSLALVNALVASLASGLFVSTLSRDSQKALGGTLLLLLFWTAGGPAIDSFIAFANGNAFAPLASFASPGYVFVTAQSLGWSSFWTGLLANQAIAWLLLALSCLLVPRTWQEKPSKTAVSGGSWSRSIRYGGPRRRIDVNPVLWLTCREGWQAVTFWLLVVVQTVGFLLTFTGDDNSVFWFLWSYLSGGVVLLLYLGTASQSCRFFIDARRSGLVELLAATPLTERQVVYGHWRALLRMFGPALALCLITQMAGTFLVQQKVWNQIARFPTTTTPATASTNTTFSTASNSMVISTTTQGGFSSTIATASREMPGTVVALVFSAATTLTTLANLAALSWFAMWMGMTSRSSNLATLKSILFVQIIPWILFWVISVPIIPLLIIPTLLSGAGGMSPAWMMWFPLLTSGFVMILSLAKDAAFITWARRKLHTEFRVRSLTVVTPVRVRVPPPIPRTAG